MADWLSYFTTYLDSSTGAWTLALAIVIGTFILEDATTILCAMAAADGRLYAPLALGSLFVGVALGDIGLFALGGLAARHPWARRVIAMDKVQAVQAWMDGRLISAVISTRFLPGARLPTYSACGFLGLSFQRFALAVIFGTVVWTTLLFTITLGLGGVIMTYFDVWRYLAGRAGRIGNGDLMR
jgi:membrane protein DedA with SNARE-associated domain